MSFKTLKDKIKRFFTRVRSKFLIRKIKRFFRENLSIEPEISFKWWNPVIGYLAVACKPFRIGPDPNRWSSLDKERLTEFLKETINASLEEYGTLFLSELDKRSEKEIINDIEIHFKGLSNSVKDHLEELKNSIDRIIENSFISVGEFESSYLRQMPDRQFIEDEKLFKFVGRDNEIEDLFSFLKYEDEQIRLITGEGGAGKTRLALEFAQRLESQGKWEAFFISHTRPFRMRQHFYKPTLLILDEPSRHKELQKIFSEVLFSTTMRDMVKLLLLDRTVFKETLSIDLRGEDSSSKFDKDLEPGDIKEFLETNYTFLDEEIKRHIVESSGDSFVFAQLFAEYAQKTGEMASLDVILNHVIDREVRVYCTLWNDESPGTKISIRRIFELISFVQPIDWSEYKSIFDDKTSRNWFSILEKIIEIAGDSHRGLVVRDESGFVLRPDPVADYIRLGLLNEEDRCTDWLDEFLPNSPFAISRNVQLSLRLGGGTDCVGEVLNDIWERLNRLETSQSDYFNSLVLFTGDLSDANFIDLEIMNPDHWQKMFEKLSDEIKDEKTKESFYRALTNATSHYERVLKLTELVKILGKLNRIYSENEEDISVQEALAGSLVNAISAYGKTENFLEMKGIFNQLLALKTDSQGGSVLFKEFISQGFVNAILYFGNLGKPEEMEEALEELRQFTKNCSRDKDEEIYGLLASGLFNAIIYYRKNNITNKKEKTLENLRNLYKKHQDVKLIYRELAKSLVGEITILMSSSRIAEGEKILNEIRDLYKNSKNDQVMQEVMMSVLINIILEYGKIRLIQKMEKALNELRRFNNKKRKHWMAADFFAQGLVNAISVYADVEDISKMEDLFIELQNVYKEDIAKKSIWEFLAQGILNLIFGYGKLGEFCMMESNLDKLRILCVEYHNNKILIEKLARGLENAFAYYEDFEQSNKFHKVLREFRELYELDREHQIVRRTFSKSLNDAVLTFILKNNMIEAQLRINELSALVMAHPNDVEVVCVFNKLTSFLAKKGIITPPNDDEKE